MRNQIYFNTLQCEKDDEMETVKDLSRICSIRSYLKILSCTNRNVKQNNRSLQVQRDNFNQVN